MLFQGSSSSRQSKVYPTRPISIHLKNSTFFMASLEIVYVCGLLVILSRLPSSLTAVDIITKTQFISDDKNEALISSDGKFQLGFFSPGNSVGRYVGIWYRFSEKQVVWVANREIPLKNSTGNFKIGEDGNLAVFDGTENHSLWSTNVSMATTNSSAKLLPSGNLVLVIRNQSDNSETLIWQSFDYPTDTVLPEMRFGFNLRTGRNVVLTSWKSSNDPASGDFSGSLDLQGSPQFFLNKSSTPLWRGGPWNGRTLSGVPDVATLLKPYVVDYSNQSNIFAYTFNNDSGGTYITFSPRVGNFPFRLTLDPLGTVQALISCDNGTWSKFWMAPEGFCDEYTTYCHESSICNADNKVLCTCLPGFKPLNPGDWFIRCVEKRKAGVCGKGDGEGFVRLEGLKLPDARFSRVYGNMSLKECEKECLKSCNCTGYASADVTVTRGGCIAWFGVLTDIRKIGDGQDFYLRVDAVEIVAQKTAKSTQARKRMLVLIILVPVALGVLLLGSCYYCFRRRQGEMKKQRRREMLFMDPNSSLSRDEDSSNANCNEDGRNVDVTFFELSTVLAATDHFSPAKKLGQGGFGPVYKGQLSNGQEIAVKRLSKTSGQGIVELKNEVLLIAKLQHRNLVRLLGCCIEEDEKMLVYEFMPNKSLDYFIFDESRKLELDWKKRFDIILGIARGILYLHQDSRLKIIHRDLKASNVLLDRDMKPKISDFGTARVVGDELGQANTNRVVGTFGYMSPEYALNGFFSTKSDVFSFGVLLVEIVSGKKNAGLFHDDVQSNLIRYAWELWREDKALEMVDSCLAQTCLALEASRCIQVGLLCVQDSITDRPSMLDVVFMLSNETTLPSPKQPLFAMRRVQLQTDSTSTGRTRSSSVNEVTLTAPNVL